MPEIDDETLKELGRLAIKVGNNPKTRRKFFEAVKEVEPARYNAQADQVIQDKIGELEAKIEQDKIERRQSEIRIETEAARKALLSRYSDEDVKKIEEMMPTWGVSDYEVAAKIYAADLKPAAPQNTAPRPSARWELPKFDGLLKDPIGSSRDMAYAVIDELNRGKR